MYLFGLKRKGNYNQQIVTVLGHAPRECGVRSAQTGAQRGCGARRIFESEDLERTKSLKDASKNKLAGEISIFLPSGWDRVETIADFSFFF